METETLIKRYLEETNIEKEKNNKTILFYGSRTRNTFHPDSDLDVLVITDMPPEFTRKGQLIDGINTETFFITWDDLEEAIVSGDKDATDFYSSAFSTGIVVKDEDLIVQKVKQKLYLLAQFQKKTVCRELPSHAKNEIALYLERYKTTSGNLKEFYYYGLLEWIRLSYHYMYHCSTIAFVKTYRMYTNREEAKNSYRLKLPSLEFSTIFLEAIDPSAEREKCLLKLLSMVAYEQKEFTSLQIDEESTGWKENDLKRIRKSLLFLNKDLLQIEDMLLYRKKEAQYNYFLILSELQYSYLRFYGEESGEFKVLFESALNTKTVDDRINALEELFHLLSSNYAFDYDDYCL